MNFTFLKQYAATKFVCVLSLLSVFGIVAPSAHADSITYTFTNTSYPISVDFTYVDATGFLSFDTGVLVPTTSTDLDS